MAKQVRVRRERPSALTWAIALAVTMLAVWLATLGAPASGDKAESAVSERVTREMVLEEATLHFAVLGRYEDAAQARISAAELAQRGAAGFVYEDAEGAHVLGAGYALLADAQRIAAQLGGAEIPEADVLTLSAEAVKLRITAPEADVACIIRADEVLRAQMDQAAVTALQLDRGEISDASAKTLAAISRSELRAAREALEAVDGAADNAVCMQLMAQLDNLADALGATARSAGSGAALSGQLRCCHVTAAVSRIEFLNGIRR